MRLENKIAVITGAGSGMGRAMANRFAAEGARVVAADWHQDGAFLGPGIRVVNVWIALTHCGDDAPGLDIVGGRLHDLVPTGTEGAWFDWSVGDPLVRAVSRDMPVVRPIFEPGDAILFDELNLHRTAITPGMTQERYAIESWFFAPSRFPDTQVPVTF